MFAAYGIDVLDPEVTPRRVWVLASRLPAWAQSPGEAWSTESELLALLVDHLANLTFVTLKAAGAKGVTRPKPLPRPRPRAASQPTTVSRGRGPAAGPASSGWADAARQLGGIPGVITRRVSDG